MGLSMGLFHGVLPMVLLLGSSYASSGVLHGWVQVKWCHAGSGGVAWLENRNGICYLKDPTHPEDPVRPGLGLFRGVGFGCRGRGISPGTAPRR